MSQNLSSSTPGLDVADPPAPAKTAVEQLVLKAIAAMSGPNKYKPVDDAAMVYAMCALAIAVQNGCGLLSQAIRAAKT